MPSFLLKLSGEALGAGSQGIAPPTLDKYCADLRNAQSSGAQIAVVLGGGNIFRGGELAAVGLDRVTGDRMGMLATVINGLAMSDGLRRAGVSCELFAAGGVTGMVAAYERDAAVRAMAEGRVVILTGGTGNPYFTTDTAACLRGIELGVDAVVKATNVDGVYSADPKTDSAAERFEHITYDEVLRRELGVMDLTAIVLCKENAMPLIVCDIDAPNALTMVAEGRTIGTRITA